MFSELDKDFTTTEEESKLLQKLSERSEWKAFKEMTERYIIKLAYNLLAGTEREEGKAVTELKELRGFTRYWKKLSGRVEQKNEKEKNSQ